MTVAVETPIASSLCNGVTTVFPHSFTLLASSDLVVIGTLGTVVTTYTEGVHYTVAGVGSPAGSITMLSAPAINTVLVRYRDTDLLRATDYQDNGDLLADTLNVDLDRLWFALQDIYSGGKGSPTALRVPNGETVAALPAASVRANSMLGFDSLGAPLLTGPPSGTAADVLVKLASATDPLLGPGLMGFGRLAYAAGTAGYQMLVGDGVNLLQFVVPQSDCENVRTGAVAMDSAWAAMMTACYGRGNATAHIPNGNYKKTGVLPVAQGVMVMGEGSQGSTEGYGTVIRDFSNVSCFRFDGSGTDFAGTGGGLQNVLIVKQPGFSGGNPVELVATSDNKRPGEMMLVNILAYGSGTGRWERGLVVDGSACVTPGDRGVRTVVAIKCRFADVTTVGETVVLNQATHFYSDGLAVDQGSGVAGGLYIKGICDGLYFTNAGIGGNVLVIANDATNATNNFHFTGKIGGTFISNDNQMDGTLRASFTGGATVLVNKSQSLKCSTNINPAFMVTMSSNANDVTGDATVANVPWNNEVFDNGNNWAVPTDTFNCACAGVYSFQLGLTMGGMVAGHTRSDISILRTGSATTSIVATANPGVQLSAGGNYSEQVAITLNLAYGDVVVCTTQVQGSTKTADIVGGATIYSWFSGSLVS